MIELERIGELERRLANLIKIGIIYQVDQQQAKAQVKLGNLISGWLKWLTFRAGDCVTYSAPSVGEQVVVLSACGELNNGIILPSIYQSSTQVSSALSGAVSIKAPKVLIEGDLFVKGSITQSEGDITSDMISLKKHKHIGNEGRDTSKPK
ncbi:phage baseplate assembly protein V [Thiotrichales bacterium 19S9-12]|nr:phage baseplate assembly protein V [Thiotrichales bacterium 19S9-11]MCF6812503.1 phage baseplate assembly protein V [Thiotrichales bacterium 19S9-12]